MRIALCQFAVTENKSSNLQKAYDMLNEAGKQGAEVAILPEMFCIAYRSELFRAAAESIPDGETCSMLQRAARETHMTIVGGSIPEGVGDMLYNTCACYTKCGELAGIYRKAHLFDVDFEGLHFSESDIITKGENLPLIVNEPVCIGVSICFDIRFPEWGQYVRDSGAVLYVLPAAFAPKTGKKHWELLLRARAVDNQMFVVGVAPAASECSYGHSMVVSPCGEVLCDLGEDEEMQVVDINLTEIDTMRRSIPLRR